MTEKTCCIYVDSPQYPLDALGVAYLFWDLLGHDAELISGYEWLCGRRPSGDCQKIVVAGSEIVHPGMSWIHEILSLCEEFEEVHLFYRDWAHQELARIGAALPEELSLHSVSTTESLTGEALMYLSGSLADTHHILRAIHEVCSSNLRTGEASTSAVKVRGVMALGLGRVGAFSLWKHRIPPSVSQDFSPGRLRDLDFAAHIRHLRFVDSITPPKDQP